MTEEKIIVSQRFSLSAPVIAKWFANQKTFLAPLGVLYLAFVISQVSLDGFSLTDFIPSNAVVTAMVLYLLNAAWDLLRKWASKTEIIVPVK